MSQVLETQVARIAEGLLFVTKLTNQLSVVDKENKTDYTLKFEQLQQAINSIDLSALIDDSKATSNDQTYSINQIHRLIQEAKNDILGGEIPDALNTLKELIAEISENEQGLAAVLSKLAKRVAVDQPQNFTEVEQAQGRSNLDAVGKKEFQAHVDKVGDLDFDYVAAIKATREAGTLPE